MSTFFETFPGKLLIHFNLFGEYYYKYFRWKCISVSTFSLFGLQLCIAILLTPQNIVASANVALKFLPNRREYVYCKNINVFSFVDFCVLLQAWKALHGRLSWQACYTRDRFPCWRHGKTWSKNRLRRFPTPPLPRTIYQFFWQYNIPAASVVTQTSLREKM